MDVLDERHLPARISSNDVAGDRMILRNEARLGQKLERLASPVAGINFVRSAIGGHDAKILQQPPGGDRSRKSFDVGLAILAAHVARRSNQLVERNELDCLRLNSHGMLLEHSRRQDAKAGAACATPAPQRLSSELAAQGRRAQRPLNGECDRRLGWLRSGTATALSPSASIGRTMERPEPNLEMPRLHAAAIGSGVRARRQAAFGTASAHARHRATCCAAIPWR